MPAVQQIAYAVGNSSLGRVLVAATENGVCAVLFDDEPTVLIKDLARRFPKADLTQDGPQINKWLSMVIAIADSPASDLPTPPLDAHGTDFQKRVWGALQQIPQGQTANYREIAKRIDAPTSYRAVAQACAANHISILIPCHRVVRSNGDVSGYRWGEERKRSLLEREANDIGKQAR